MNLTLREIASQLGLSMSTVSRVLNNKPNVNKETRDKVLAYLRGQNNMHLVARRSRMAINDVVAVVIPDISEDYFDFVVRGIEKDLWKNHIGMMLCDTMEDVDKESQVMRMLIEKRFSGIILATVDKDERRLTRYLQSETNLIFFDNLPNISKPYNSVITDNVKASQLAVGHLAGLGHREIGFISGRPEETTGFERLVGYRRAVELGHLSQADTLIVYGDYKEQSGYQGMRRLMLQNPGMTAVYIASSKMTYGALKALADAGKRVPEDIAVVGFDIHDKTGLIRPGITSIIQHEDQIGRLCVELLLKERQREREGRTDKDRNDSSASETASGQAGNGKAATMNVRQSIYQQNQRILLEPRLVIRGSCGAVISHRR